ncbi:PrsW family intramembrane metalloprotease [Agrobacterium sp. V1]|uniref:PrsW family intramembrane metalloprotease n=1 Tax=Agrobacterium sp. V1 TaxID=3061957 RepID=UPI0026729519|nr:PrsW family glutamic-type intramembrane protease [Agrobacterium sp. V1]MDO3442894.1 PrsW family glutamic-type intramembrane protease [Agrobacterium sp. V1]
MKKNYYVALFWPLLAMLAWLAVMARVWMNIGTAGVAWGLPLSAIVSLLVANTFCWLGQWVEGRPGLLLSAFAWGASLAALCSIWSQEGLQAILEGYASAEFTNSFFSLANTPIAALSKGLFVIWMLKYNRSQIRGPLDGIIYGGLTGAGYAFIDQVMYFGLMAIRYVANDATDAIGFQLSMSFIQRGMLIPFLHPFLGALVGLGLAVATASSRRLRQAAAVLVAIASCAVWEWDVLADEHFILDYEIYTTVMYVSFIALAITALILRRYQAKAVLCGTMSPVLEKHMAKHDIALLRSLRKRRRWREEAKLRAGRTAARLTGRYQAEASALAIMIAHASKTGDYEGLADQADVVDRSRHQMEEAFASSGRISKYIAR